MIQLNLCKKLFVLLCLFCACPSTVMAASGTREFTEHFADTIYKDTAKTTADWGLYGDVLSLPLTGVVNQAGPSAARDAAGNLVLAWSEPRGGGTEAVYLSKFSPEGVKMWGDIKVGDGISPKLACDKANNIYVAFSPNQTSRLYIYKYNSSGVYVSSFRADTDALPANPANHDIAIDSAGNIFVVYDYLVTRFNSSGVRAWGPVRANSHNAGDTTGLFLPDVTVAGPNLYVSHHDLPGTGPFGLNINRIDPANGSRLWASEVRVADGAWLKIAGESTGNVSVVYSDNYSVTYKKYGPSGAVIAGPLTIDNDPYAYKSSPDISIDAADYKYIVYKFNSSFPAAVYRIRVQKLAPSDNLVWGPAGKQISFGGVSYAKPPVCVPTPSGGALAAWTFYEAFGYDNNHDDIKANILNSSGVRLLEQDWIIHNSPEYAASATAQSLTIDNVVENIKSVTLTNTWPEGLNGQKAAYYLTNNGGINWYQVYPGTRFDFPVTGSDLRFKTVLSTANRSVFVSINALTITYDYADLTGDTTPPTGSPTVPQDQGVYSTQESVIFSWTKGTSADPQTGIVQYQMQVASDRDFTNTFFLGDVGNVTSYTVTGLVQGTTYYARVRAKNGAGLYGIFSGSSDGIKIDTTAPTGWSIVKDTGSTTTKPDLTFTWDTAAYADPESGIVNYQLWVRPDTNFNSVPGVGSLYYGFVGNVSSFTVPGAVVGTTYYAKVRAFNGAGREAASSFFGLSSDGIRVLPPDTTLPTGVPSIPTDRGAYGTASLTFNWTIGTAADPESGIASYYLQVASDGSFVNLKHNANVGNVKSFTVSGCTNALTYYARVKACNASGFCSAYSGISNGIVVDVTSPLGVPSVPADQGTSTTSKILNFSWNNNTSVDAESGISGYYLQVATDTAFSTLKFNGYVGAVTSYSVSDCIAGSVYYARVRSRNGAGAYGSYSAASDGIKVLP